MDSVRERLRERLGKLGYDVASDSHGLRRDLYIVGDGDLAQGLFEFMPTAAEACDRMYQGSWVEGLPPRFAVLPSSESQSPELELLEQIRIVPVFFELDGGRVEFPHLEAILAQHLPA